MKNLKILIYLVLCFVFVGCNVSKIKTIKEQSIVLMIKKSTNVEDKKYWIVTEDYNFYSNEKYNVGDTVQLTK